MATELQVRVLASLDRSWDASLQGQQWWRIDVRRRHLLAAEDDLGDLHADLAVVHNEGGLPCKTMSASNSHPILLEHHRWFDGTAT